jgi:quercetin dioxygenase-like cupin family protein
MTFPAHSHPHEQFVVGLDGLLEFEIEGKGKRTLGPHGVFYFAPNERHGAKVVGDRPVTIVEAFHPIRLDYVDGATADNDVPR